MRISDSLPASPPPLEPRLPEQLAGQWLATAIVGRLRSGSPTGRSTGQLRPEYGAQGNRRVAAVSRVLGDLAPDLPAFRQGPQDRHVH